MTRPLKLLIIEDVLADFLLLERHIREHGMTALCRRVGSEEELSAALTEPWDLVLSDYNVPSMAFTDTLAKIHSLNPDLPIILVSGSVGEETAVELLHLGLADFILKDNPVRLTTAIQRALDEAHERRARRDAEELYRVILEGAADAVMVVNRQGRFIYANREAGRLLGYDPSDFLKIGIKEITPDDDMAATASLFDKLLTEGFLRIEFYRKRKDGSLVFVELNAIGLPDGNFYGSFRDLTERKKAEAKQYYLNEALRQTSQPLLLGTPQAWATYVNPAFTRLFGYRLDHMVGKPIVDFVPPTEDEQSLHAKAIDQVLACGSYSFEAERMSRDGERIPVLINLGTIRDEKGVPVGLVASYVDLRPIREKESMLRKLSLAVEQSPQSIIITGLDGKIEYVNDAFVDKSGYGRDEILGRNPNFLKSYKTPKQTYEALWFTLNKGQVWQGEFINRRKDGSEYPDRAIIAPLHQPDGRITHYVAIQEDITERKQALERIEDLAFYDPLTRLPNRRLLLDRLHQALASSMRNKRMAGLMLIDLDNFKILNDTFGHGMGDQLLLQVAAMLIGSVRDGDTVARLGGDEFVLLLEDLSPNPLEAAAFTKIVGEKILAALCLLQVPGSQEYQTGASIGATLLGEKPGDPEELLKQVDIGMYQAKTAGGNTIRFFNTDLQNSIKARTKMVADLRRGIKENQFLLYYQPQVDKNGQRFGAEVLVRWLHPTDGIVPPATFIPLAEETGLILSLGEWVLETACAQLVRWADQPGMAHLTVAVNVSARQFRHADFVNRVLAIFKRTGVNPKMVKLELTESLLVENVQDVIEKMAALKAEGVNFSLDDFGTGYSSLAYLKRLPLDQLKIDQSFVRDVLTDSNDAVIAKTIVALANSLGLSVIAEGVETEAQRDFLYASGCTAYQGYFFGRPLPLRDFERFAPGGALPSPNAQ